MSLNARFILVLSVCLSVLALIFVVFNTDSLWAYYPPDPPEGYYVQSNGNVFRVVEERFINQEDPFVAFGSPPNPMQWLRICDGLDSYDEAVRCAWIAKRYADKKYNGFKTVTQ